MSQSKLKFTKFTTISCISLQFLLLSLQEVSGCSNLLVTPGASADGSTIYGYAADSAGLYGTLDRLPAQDHAKGAKKKIWDWDSGVYLGEIDEVEHTYDVVGNMNEFQLTIGETTFGGLPILCKGNQKNAIMDYGNLIWTTLQRAKSVQEALTIIPQLLDQYGYVSEGESFTLSDPKEVWIFELIGKGNLGWGAVWVAQKIPDGHVSGHANQARIREIPKNFDSTWFRHSKDVVEFAIENKFFDPNKDGGLENFSFSDVYCPVTFVQARVAEARVYSFFSKVARKDLNFKQKYERYALGFTVRDDEDDIGTNSTTSSKRLERMPLSIPIEKKLTVNDMFWHMRDRFEDTAMNMTWDVGSSSWQSKYRERPLIWEYQNEKYINERSIGTQQTGWHFVSNMRSWLPNWVGGVFWFGVDDTSFSVRVPFYSYTNVPKALTVQQGSPNVGAGRIDKFSFESLFWLNNLVANRVYYQWNTLEPLVSGKVREIEEGFMRMQEETEKGALSLPTPQAGQEVLSIHSNACTDLLVNKWTELWVNITIAYRDGVVVLAPKDGHDHGGNRMGGPVAPVIEGSGRGDGMWRESWRERIVEEGGDHFRLTNRNRNRKETLKKRKVGESGSESESKKDAKFSNKIIQDPDLSLNESESNSKTVTSKDESDHDEIFLSSFCRKHGYRSNSGRNNDGFYNAKCDQSYVDQSIRIMTGKHDNAENVVRNFGNKNLERSMTESDSDGDIDIDNQIQAPSTGNLLRQNQQLWV